MTEQELNKLLDTAIGTKGNLQIHSYWMNKIIKGLMDLIPIKISQLKNDKQYTSKKDVLGLINSIDLSNYVTETGLSNFVTLNVENKYYPKTTIDTKLYSLKDEMLDMIVAFFKSEFVDLGLPSGLLWASCNLGAKKPYDYGSYFAWGETEGKSSGFTFSNYKLCNGSMNTLTKYNTNSSYGTVDNLTTLELIDDAAHHFDNSCRIPTIADVEELLTNTTITTNRINNHVVYILTSKINNNSITIPASGYDNAYSKNFYSYIWTNSIDNNDSRKGYYFSIGESLVGNIYFAYRSAGYSIRAVKDKCYTKPEIDSLITSTLNTEV